MGQVAFGQVTTMPGGQDTFLAAVTDLTIVGGVLYVTSEGMGGGVAAYRMLGGELVLLDRISRPGAVGLGVDSRFLCLDLGDDAIIGLVTGAEGVGLWAVSMDASGGFLGAAALGGLATVPPDLRAVHQAGVAGTSHLFAAVPGSEDVAVWEISSVGNLRPATAMPDGAVAGVGVAALQSISLEGQTYLLAASDGTGALISYGVSADGGLTEVGRVDVTSGIGISSPSDLAVLEVAGQGYVVMASAGSGSLTVAAVAADGSLSVTDHVMDDLDTRFQRAHVVEGVIVSGRAYVVAAGADDGLTLFELLPGGQLLDMGSVADTVGTTLGPVSSLALTEVGGRLHIMASSGAEPGLTWLSVDLSATSLPLLGTGGDDILVGTAADDLLVGRVGDDRLSGGAGADILLDGAGQDVLTGGAGADTFVLAADGALDRITDFDPAMDALDLSGWALLRSDDQLDIATTATGAEVRFGDEVLILATHDAAPLDLSQGMRLDAVPVSRLMPHWIPEAMPSEPLPAPEETAPDELDPVPPDRSPARIVPDDGGIGFVTVYGSGGNDTLLGLDGDDRLDGGPGRDTIIGGLGADTVWGGEGDDLIRGLGGNDTLYGGGGKDRVYGNAHVDELYGDDGADVLNGGYAADWLWGGAGNDRLEGMEGADVLWGDSGDDWLLGNASDDVLYGGSGRDTLSGGLGSDQIHGGEDDDEIYGNVGADSLFGGAGHDTLFGNPGADWLEGGPGNDILHGGLGADVFIFDEGTDRILDFTYGLDTLALNDDLWGGQILTTNQVLAMATRRSGDIVFDFGVDALLILEGKMDIDRLADGLIVF